MRRSGNLPEPANPPMLPSIHGSCHCYFTMPVLRKIALFVDLLFWPVLPHRPLFFGMLIAVMRACRNHRSAIAFNSPDEEKIKSKCIRGRMFAYRKEKAKGR
jgi:hypothetical protein